MNNNIILLNVGTDNSIIKDYIIDKINYPPFALLSLEAFLKIHNYQTMIFDFHLNKYTKSKFINEIYNLSSHPLAVCISTYTENFELSKNVISIFKKHFPTTKIIMGGPHVSFLPAEAFELGADYVVMFEGESTLITLLEHIKYPEFVSLNDIKGLAFKKDDKLLINTKRNFIKNLDYLPFVTSLRVRDKVKKKLYLITSRGCPGKCIFCASNAYSGRKYRAHTAEWIYSFLVFYKEKNNIQFLSIIDDTFMVNKKRLKKIFQYFNNSNFTINWEARCRVDQLNEKFIKFLSSNGCTDLHLGIESANQRVLDSINKSYRIDSFYNNCKLLLKYGIFPKCSFIIGHHSDTLETIEQTLLLAYKLQANNLGFVAIGISTPFPGTYLLNNAKELGIKIITKRWSNYTLSKPIYSTVNFTKDDIRKAYYIFHYNKNRFDIGKTISNSPLIEFRKKINLWIQELIEIKNNYNSN